MTRRNRLARAVAMDREELRTRVMGALRTYAGRVRFAVSPPRWRRERLLRALDSSAGPLVEQAVCALRGRDSIAAHRALAVHMQTRTSVWPLNAGRRTRLSADIAAAFPRAAEHAREAADQVLSGRFDLLGYRGVIVGDSPAWHRDAVHARDAPRTYWASVPYLDPASGDHKVIWELNRHQHFLTLGTAYWLTGDGRYRDGFVRHLEGWLAENPPLAGINWASMLELAFRALSWTWAVEFFSFDAPRDASPWLVDLLAALDVQLSHIANNLSTYFSPNTHLSGEALALYAVSTAFPELRRSPVRAAIGRSVLLRESERQVLGDGGHAELSPHYHRYSTDFYLLAYLVARAAGDEAAAVFERTAHRQAAYLRTIADDDGRLPLIGDDDGGRLFHFDSRPAWDASTTLSVAASVLSDPTLAVGPAASEVFWILGERPEADRAAGTTVWPSHLLAESGYFVSRSPRGNHLIFDAGRHGFLNGGHAHSDALSVVLTVGGRPLLVDPGTATYTMDRAVRDAHRAARMHNSLLVDGRDPSVPAGPFHWESHADARVLVARTSREMDFAVGALRGRAGSHMRAVLTLHGVGWLIVDYLGETMPVTADVWWHLHPMWDARQCAGGVIVESADGVRLGLAFSQGDVRLTRDPDVAAVSFEYGVREIGTAIHLQHRAAGPFALACFVPEASVRSDQLRIREADRGLRTVTEWDSVMFDVTGGTAPDFSVELWFPQGREDEPEEGWPQPCIQVGRANEMPLCVE